MMAVRSACSERPKWAAAHLGAGAGRGQSGVGALANQLPLELGQGGKQVKHEPALGRGRVEGIGEGNQARAVGDHDLALETSATLPPDARRTAQARSATSRYRSWAFSKAAPMVLLK